VQPKSEPVAAPAVNEPSVVDVGLQTPSSSVSTVQDVPKVESAPQSEVTPLSSTVLSAVGLAPSADGDAPELPADSPLLLAGLAAFRRQTQQASTGDESLAKSVADPSQTSLMMADAGSGESMMMAAAVANSAPTAAPVVGVPDQSSGAVSVALNAVDADGNPLVYSVTSQPVNGTLRVDGAGAYTYTPTQAARLAAGSTTPPDFDSFTVSVSDGQGGVTPVTVSVPVLPAVWANQASSSNVTGASPYGVAVVGTTAYVANQGTNTVSVINTSTGQTIGAPLVVGSAPTGAVASVDGKYVFVSNRNSGTVSVIRTADNKVIDINPATPTTVDAIKVGSQPEFMAVNTSDISTPTGVVAKGTRLYVANYGSGTVSVIDISNPEAPKVVDTNTATPTVVDAIKVGTNPRSIGFVVTPNGPRLYVVNRGSGTVSVVDAATNKAIDLNPATTTTIDAITVGSAPQQIVINGDGTRAYVTNFSSNSVSIIDTTTNKVVDANPATQAVDAIAVPSTPIGVAISKDGSLVYVANGNDRVSVIDTKTMKVVNTIQIDTAPDTNNYHTMVMRSDGAMIITDMTDKALRVVTYQRGNTAPVAIANPTVGAPNPSTGAVTGSVNLKDWDGDPLTYTTVSGPTRGTVSYNAAAGTYTYTPTTAARDAAANGGPTTDTFTVRATDPASTYANTTPITVTIAPSQALPPNQAPVASTPTINTRDMTTGAVTGSWTVTDPDGNPLTYTVVGPTNGTVDITRQGSTYTYTYTPTQAARLPAAGTPEADSDAFTVTFSDGRASVNVAVNVPVLPAKLADTTFINYLPNGSKPVAVAISGSRAYVVNSGTNTLTVHDLNGYNNVIATIPVAANPTSVAVSANTNRAYVSGVSSITVIDTTNYTVVGTIPVGTGQWNGVAVTQDGSRVYATNSATGKVSVIDPVSNTITGTIQVGATPAGVTFSPDGKVAYVANRGANTVTVINALTNTVAVNAIPVGAGPVSVAVSPDGTRAYVANYDGGSVTVINTANYSVVGSPIQVGAHPTSVSVSPDGSLAYVGIDTGIFVINTKTNSWADHRYINYGANTHTVGLSANGREIYIADMNESSLRQISIVRGNTAPAATAAPTAGTPEPILGSVTGRLNVADPDGDYLSYRVNGQLTTGTVTFDDAAGTYTFTPNQATRDLAAQSSQPYTVSFTVTASDNVYPGALSTDVVVTVPVAPSGAAIPVTTTPINVGGSPGKVIVSNGRMYVYNNANNTVTVINSTTNQVVGTVTVPAANDFVVRSDGRLYVAGYDTVTVVDPNSQVVATVQVPDLCEGVCYGSAGSVIDLAINPGGTRVYAVREYYTDTGMFSAISMIDTGNNTLTTTVSTYQLTDIEVSPDGTRIYGAEGDYRFVQVFDAATLAGPSIIGISGPGEWPYATNVAISPDGKRTYAIVGPVAWAPQDAVSISVIDSDPTSATYNTQIATINLPGAIDVAFSPDSRRAYVLMSDRKTVRVIDTATNSVVGYFTVSGAASIAVAPNGTVYLTDSAGGIVNVVTVGSTAM
jgi:YVTN family beta-propeller protein/VCBS repeat-containing protein